MTQTKRIRQSNWADENTYLKMGSIWSELWSRSTQEIIGEPTPQKIPTASIGDVGSSEWSEYTGPLDPEDKP